MKSVVRNKSRRSSALGRRQNPPAARVHRDNSNLRNFGQTLNPVIPTGVEEPAVAPSLQLRFRNFPVLGIALLVISCAASGQIARSQDAPQLQLAEITNSLANGAVTSIEILHMPDQVKTRASVTPQALEKWFDFKITINRVREWSGRDELAKVLKATQSVPASRMVDMRSAIVFNGLDGKRIGTLYVGRFFGRYLGQFGGVDGAIGDMPVSFKGDLPSWLKEMIPTPLR